jgi:hypothetical protein
MVAYLPLTNAQDKRDWHVEHAEYWGYIYTIPLESRQSYKEDIARSWWEIVQQTMAHHGYGIERKTTERHSRGAEFNREVHTVEG